MKYSAVIFVLLVLASGCFHTAIEEKSCEEIIAELPSIIEANQNNFFPVERAIDGDTIELGNGDRIRLIGVDTPERGEFYYDEAKTFTAGLVVNGVYLIEDIEDKDKYDRLLRYAFTNDTFVNAELVREGYAKTLEIEPDTKYSDLFACLEIEAKQNRKGIWK